MELAREQKGELEDVACRLAFAEQSLKATLEVTSMRAQSSRDSAENGAEEAWQMTYIIEQRHDVVQSGSYRTAREALTVKIETEAAKQPAETHL